MMTATWMPSLSETDNTLHERVVESIRGDIETGVLQPGERLPTHRELARTLGIGIGTVTRAYAEAERLGLLSSRVGRGTFVAERMHARMPQAAESGPIDLSMNIPVLAPASSRFPAALHAASRRPDLNDVLFLSGHAGLEAHRCIYARWLTEQHGVTPINWERLVVCSGAQHAMSLAVRHLTKPGDTMLVEEATFFGMRTIAQAAGIRLHGVALDEDGICLDALEAAVEETGARLLYIQPTLQNPTARTMPARRRRAMAHLCRSLGLTVIESDVYGALALEAHRSIGVPAPPEPLVNLLPGQSWFVCSASKGTAPGLRIGFLLCPDAAAVDAISFQMRAECFSPPALPSVIAAQWIADGTARTILSEIAIESARRLILAGTLIGDAADRPSFPTSLHVWLPMDELRAERVLNTALRNGVTLTPPSAISLPGSNTTGLRLCLNNPQSYARLTTALDVLAGALQDRQETTII